MQEFHPQYTEATEQQREPSEYNVNVVGRAWQSHPVTITHELGLGTADIARQPKVNVQSPQNPHNVRRVEKIKEGLAQLPCQTQCQET